MAFNGLARWKCLYLGYGIVAGNRTVDKFLSMEAGPDILAINPPISVVSDLLH
jgi:hypothetical protein